MSLPQNKYPTLKGLHLNILDPDIESMLLDLVTFLHQNSIKRFTFQALQFLNLQPLLHTIIRSSHIEELFIVYHITLNCAQIFNELKTLDERLNFNRLELMITSPHTVE